MKRFFLHSKLLMAGALWIVLPLTAAAQANNPPAPPPPGPGGSFTLTNPLSVSGFPDLIQKLLTAVMIIAVPVIVLFLVIAGFRFVTARGDTGKLQDARRNFMYVIIGAAVLLGAQALSVIIKGTLGQFGVTF